METKTSMDAQRGLPKADSSTNCTGIAHMEQRFSTMATQSSLLRHDDQEVSIAHMEQRFSTMATQSSLLRHDDQEVSKTRRKSKRKRVSLAAVSQKYFTMATQSSLVRHDDQEVSKTRTKSKRKRVSWAAVSQIRYFEADHAPSSAGKLGSDVFPQLTWETPNRYDYNPSWQVAFGEESQEVLNLKQRERHFLETNIPDSPEVPQKSENSYNEAHEFQIPSTAIEEHHGIEMDNNGQYIKQGRDEEVLILGNEEEQVNSESLGSVLKLKASCAESSLAAAASTLAFSATALPCGSDQFGNVQLMHTAAVSTLTSSVQITPISTANESAVDFGYAEPDVAAASAIAHAIMSKATEKGSFIDTASSIEILNSPKLMEHLVSSKCCNLSACQSSLLAANCFSASALSIHDAKGTPRLYSSTQSMPSSNTQGVCSVISVPRCIDNSMQTTEMRYKEEGFLEGKLSNMGVMQRNLGSRSSRIGSLVGQQSNVITAAVQPVGSDTFSYSSELSQNQMHLQTLPDSGLPSLSRQFSQNNEFYLRQLIRQYGGTKSKEAPSVLPNCMDQGKPESFLANRQREEFYQRQLIQQHGGTKNKEAPPVMPNCMDQGKPESFLENRQREEFYQRQLIQQHGGAKNKEAPPVIPNCMDQGKPESFLENRQREEFYQRQLIQQHGGTKNKEAPPVFF